MANVVITGGGGFLGARLARELLAAGSLAVAGSGKQPISQLTLLDRVPVPADLAADRRVSAIRGDLGELLEPAGRGGPGRPGRRRQMRRPGRRRMRRPGPRRPGARWPGPT